MSNIPSLDYALTILNSFNTYPHILEFGVYRGDTITKISKMFSKTHKIFGFDSFEGLPEDWNNTPCNKGFFSTFGNIPNVEGVVFYKGWFENTITDYKHIQQDISLLHIDCDLYSSTKTVLWNLNEVIKNNTIIVFDEWFYCDNNGNMNSDHEQKCFYEWVNEFNRSFECIDYKSSAVNDHERKIIRITK